MSNHLPSGMHLVGEHSNLDNAKTLRVGIPIPGDIMPNHRVIFNAEAVYYMARVPRHVLTVAGMAIASFDGKTAKDMAQWAGRQGLELEPDLEKRKRILLASVRAKFAADDALADELRATGAAEIVEDGTGRGAAEEGDRLWGKVQAADGTWEGQNLAGEILMQVRREVNSRYEVGGGRYFASEEERSRTVHAYVYEAFAVTQASAP